MALPSLATTIAVDLVLDTVDRMTVPKLKEALEAKGLVTSGLKAELTQRLKSAL